MNGKRKIFSLFLLFGISFQFLFSMPAASENLPVFTLQEGIQLVCRNNPAVKAAYLEEEASSKDVVIARSRLLPSVDAMASIDSLANQPAAKFGSLEANTAERNSVTYGVSLDQLIFDFGASGSIYRAAKSSREVKRLTADQTRNTVILNFIFAYYDVLEADKMLEVAEKEKEQLEGHRKTAQSLYDQGVITKNDLLQAKVRLADAEQRLITARNLKEIYMARVNTILSRPTQEKFQPVEPSDGEVAVPELAKAWYDAEEQRAELKIISRRMESTGLQEKAKQAEFLPRISLQAGYSYTENKYVVFQDNWFSALNFNLAIFNGGATAAAVEKLRKQQEELAEEAKKTENDIRLEVEKYFLALKNAEEQLSVAKDAVGEAEENLKINETRYEEGTGTATDVLDAITLLTVAQTNHHRALYDMKRAYAGFVYATGRDLAVDYGVGTTVNASKY